MVNIKIHRGTSQIGGTITEIYTENTHIFIDFGSELSVNPKESTDDKMIDMINNAECDAVLFSHYHGDHVGLFHTIPEKDVRGRTIQFGMGAVARKVLVNIHETLVDNRMLETESKMYHQAVLDRLKQEERWINFKDMNTYNVGDFHITTIRVDHSAYDSYMFVLEAEGKCIVHTGDFRVHGRLGEGFFDRLHSFMGHKTVDTLLIEGTMLGRLGEKIRTEQELQDEATNILLNPENKYVYLICSSTNMESLASFHKAVLFSNSIKERRGDDEHFRAMYLNSYVKKQLNVFATAEPEITYGFNKANQFEPQGEMNELLGMPQVDYMKKHGCLILLGRTDAYQKYIELFKDDNPLLIYSMWDGYVKDKEADTYDEKWGALYDSFERKEELHTSGHAGKEGLEEMIRIVNPCQAVIPIHTEYKASFEAFVGSEKLKCLNDGEVFGL